MPAPRSFSIYLSTGAILSVAAPSLRKALSAAEKKLPAGAEIVAAIDADCLPAPSSAAMPFHAVLLQNPSFAASPE